MELIRDPVNTLRIIKKYPFKPLENIIKLCCVKEKDCAIALYYSEDFPFIDDKVQRSQCYFGMVKVLKNKGNTAIMIIQQDEYEKGTLSDRSNMLASEIVQWALVFKKNIYKHSVNSKNNYN